MSRAAPPAWAKHSGKLALRCLVWLPFGAVARLFALLSIFHAVLQPRRLRQALAWAKAQDRTGLRQWGLALALVGNRGYFTAIRAVAAYVDPDQFRRLVRLEGREHLELTRDGAIFLNFHLGPSITSRTLLAYGYGFTITGVGQATGWPHERAAWGKARQASDIVWPDASEAARAVGLYQLRRRLQSGKAVRLAADGTVGVEVFRVDIPGGSVSIKSGWWTLRRLTGARAIPLLSHREGSRFVLAASPPLPPPVADAAEDARICQEVLTRLIAEHLKRFPEQCSRTVCAASERKTSVKDAGADRPRVRSRTGEA